MSARRLIALLAVAWPLAFAASAHAYVYWTDPQAGTIGRANLDGTDATDSFIHVAGKPLAVAVDAGHIYWANQSEGTIGRANLDGTGIEPAFIGGLHEPSGVVVTSAYIFWTSTKDGAIGRAKLDGSEARPALVAAGVAPCGIAADSGSIYWSNVTGLEAYVGRASFTGASANIKFARAEGAATICGLAVNSASIFWTDTGFLGSNGTTIGSASVVNGGSPRPSLIGEASGPCGIAILGTQLYWANAGNSTIGRANTDGTAVNEDLIDVGAGEICGVALDSLSSPIVSPPSTEPTAGPGGSPAPGSSASPPSGAKPLVPPGSVEVTRVKKDRSHGTARLSIAVNAAGAITVSGKGVATAQARTAGPGTVTVTVRPAKAEMSALRKTGKLTTKVSVSFAPANGGAAAKTSRSLTLRLAAKPTSSPGSR
jgi:virginiamycin B lyase